MREYTCSRVLRKSSRGDGYILNEVDAYVDVCYGLVDVIDGGNCTLWPIICSSGLMTFVQCGFEKGATTTTGYLKT